MADSPEHGPVIADDERAARRTVLLLALGLIAVLLGAAVIGAAVHRRDQRRRAAAASAADAGTVGRGDLGPEPATDVATYVATRKAALAQARGERVAVVSLARYATEAEARSAIGSVRVRLLLVAAPGGSPAVVDDVGAWAADQRRRATADRAQIEQLLQSGSVDDPDFRSFYQSEVTRLKALETMPATAPVVFGVAVRGSVDQLRAIAVAPGIRLVDVGPSDSLPTNATVRGLRPEETTRAGQPPTRPS